MSASDATRADDKAPDIGWHFGPDHDTSDTDGKPASKLDPDFLSDHRMAEKDWMQQCLTDPAYLTQALESLSSRQP